MLINNCPFCRYPPHGRKPVKMEEGIEWSRIRASPVDTSPHDLHVSDCLNDLRPGDHFEIQWRKSKEFPYGMRVETGIQIFDFCLLLFFFKPFRCAATFELSSCYNYGISALLSS